MRALMVASAHGNLRRGRRRRAACVARNAQAVTNVRKGGLKSLKSLARVTTCAEVGGPVAGSPARIERARALAAVRKDDRNAVK